MTHSLNRRLLLASMVSVGVLAACGGSDDDSLDDRSDTADPKVRFVHAVPDGPNVTLQRNGTAETGVTNLAYKDATQYYDVGTEDYTFSLRNATDDTEITSLPLTTERGNKYTIVALPDGNGGVQLLTITDPYNKSLTSNDARLRVINAAPNAAGFDVYLTAADADLAAATPQFVGVDYGEAMPASGADSVDLPGGSYRLRVTPTGSKEAFFDVTVQPPENGDWLLIALPETSDPNSIRLLLVRSDDSADPTDEITPV